MTRAVEPAAFEEQTVVEEPAETDNRPAAAAPAADPEADDLVPGSPAAAALGEASGKGLPAVDKARRAVAELPERWPDNRAWEPGAVASESPVDRPARPVGAFHSTAVEAAADVVAAEVRPDSPVGLDIEGVRPPAVEVAARPALGEFPRDGRRRVREVAPDNRQPAFHNRGPEDRPVSEDTGAPQAAAVLQAAGTADSPGQTSVAEVARWEIAAERAAAEDTAAGPDSRASGAFAAAAAADTAAALAAGAARHLAEPVETARPPASRTGGNYRVGSVAGHGIRIVCSGTCSWRSFVGTYRTSTVAFV